MRDPEGRTRGVALPGGRRHRVLLTGLVLASLLAACSDSPEPARPDGPSPTATNTAAAPTASTAPTATPRPAGPRADLSPLSGGRGVFLGAATGQPAPEGYVEEEYVAEGSASSYRPVGELEGDGQWTFRPSEQASYRTRVVVRRPARAADHSGTVLVEWLNVSGGLDADPAYQTVRELITREGHTWMGVSVQQIGVEGGPVAVTVDVPGAASVVGRGLKLIDPERYGSLAHPGDAFVFDILTQVARTVRAGGAVTGGAAPDRVLAIGVSQSAFGLVSYLNGVQPLTRAFDGFFVQSRGAGGLAVPADGGPADIAGSIFEPPTIIRTDTDVPVFELQSETDVVGILNSVAARQPDTDLMRTWEVAGTAHADLHLLGGVTAGVVDCGVPVNDGPLHVVAKAAMHHLVTWVSDGELPPTGAPLTVGPAGLQRDPDGIAFGGVRTPPVDVPVRVLSGAPGREDSALCLLFGSTRPLPETTRGQRYAGRGAYLQRYARAAAAVIEAGYVLEEDHDALLGYAHPELVPDPDA